MERPGYDINPAIAEWASARGIPVQSPPVSLTEPKNGGTLNILGVYPPGGWDPHRSLTYRLHTPYSFTNERPLRYDYGAQSDPTGPGLRPIAGVVESWEYKDPTTLVLNIRKGVKFHDIAPVNGREMVASDIKFTLERIQNTVGAGQAIKIKDLVSITIIDEYTLELKTRVPVASLLDHLGGVYFEILAPEVQAKFGDFVREESIIGVGPFQLLEYDPGNLLVYERHPNYYDPDRPHVDRVQYINIPSSQTQTQDAAFRTGQLDIMRDISPSRYGNLSETNPDAFYQIWVGGNAPQALAFQVNDRPFNDLRVRQAMSLAIDREGWIDSIYKGWAMFAGSVMPGQGDFWLPPAQHGKAATDYYKYDPVRARALLADAGFPNGFEIDLNTTPAYPPPFGSNFELVAQSLQDIGIKVNIKTKEYGAFITTTYRGKYEGAGYFYPFGDATEPDEFLMTMLHSEGVKNQSQVKDTVLDAMLEAQSQEIDLAKRIEIVHDIQRYMGEQIYMIFAPKPVDIAGIQPWIKNWSSKQGYDWGGPASVAWIVK